jgi:hypothetical protein
MEGFEDLCLAIGWLASFSGVERSWAKVFDGQNLRVFVSWAYLERALAVKVSVDFQVMYHLWVILSARRVNLHACILFNKLLNCQLSGLCVFWSLSVAEFWALVILSDDYLLVSRFTIHLKVKSVDSKQISVIKVFVMLVFECSFGTVFVVA